MYWFLFDGNNICGKPLSSWKTLPELAKKYHPAPVMWVCYSDGKTLIVYNLDMVGVSLSCDGGDSWSNCAAWREV